MRLDPPGFLDDLSDADKLIWSDKISSWLDQAAAGNPADNDGPRSQFFNPLHTPAGPDAQVATISWTAFPRRVKSSSLSDMQRWRTADSSRNYQDEYCEWSVSREATGSIARVTFTCEGPEYWETLAELDPDKVLELYQRHVDPRVRKSDLFQSGQYVRRNRWNSNTSDGAMHLIQAANTLGAEIELAAAATIRRVRDGAELTDAQALILCSQYGDPGRNSDPHIGEQVNALARQKADLTLNNPIGLYFGEFNPVGWVTPDGTDPRDFWTHVRGKDGHFVRAVFEVPADRGYSVSDIRIAGRPIKFGSQIADFITMKLEGVATRIGASTAEPVQGCRGEGAAPPGLVALAPLPDRNTGIAESAAASPPEAPNLPEALLRRLDVEVVEAGAAPPALLPYPRLPDEKLAPVQVTGRMMAYASPDSTYFITRRLLRSAQNSVVIGIYDFSAGYMKEELKRAMRRGVSVTLMLDTNQDDDPNLFAELTALGADCEKAPSSSAHNPTAYFGNAHEKIIVVDGKTVMIQSGNWSENSIPFNEGDGVVVGEFAEGNRDMGLAVESRALAEFFAELVLRDIRLSRGQPPDAAPPEAPAAVAIPAESTFFETAPDTIPTQLFPSLTLQPSQPVTITPVITPENFEAQLVGLLRSAERSIRIEQQYIRGGQPAVEAMLDAIVEARDDHPELDIKIIVSPKFLFGDKRTKFLDTMEQHGFDFDEQWRFLSANHFVHCHNKLIVVDEARTLIGSQNWSTTGIQSNRETSLLVELPAIAAYFAQIFDADWDASESAGTPPDMAARPPSDFSRGGVVLSRIADYADV